MRISDGSSDVCSSDLLEKFRDAVEAEYQRILGSDEAGTLKLLPEDIDYMRSFFPKPAYRPVEQVGTDLAAQAAQEPAFAAWIKRNLAPHRQPGYHAVFVSLKAHGEVAGDVSSEQYEEIG